MAILAGYFDESGGLDTPVMTVGGFVSDIHRWKKFEREWRRVLRDYNLDYFHMKDYAQSKKKFGGWNQWKRDRLIERLIFTIRANIRFSVSCIIMIQDYEEIFPPELRKVLRHPYHLCLRECFNGTLKYLAQKKIEDEVGFIFDENDQFKHHALEIHSGYKDVVNASNKHQFGPISFADDKAVSPLQASDLFAYIINKVIRGHRRNTAREFNNTDGVYSLWDRKKLLGYKKFLRERGLLTSQQQQNQYQHGKTRKQNPHPAA